MKKGIALVFPGQGSQYVGMGLDLYKNYPEIKDLFLQANEILNFDLKELCFNGPIEKLTETINAQPAIFLVSFAAWMLLAKEGIIPEVMAGHSLGEYTALAVADAFNFNDGLKLVMKRAELMQKAATSSTSGKYGEMIAVLGLEEEKVEKVTASLKDEGVITIANYNSPGQIIVSGESKVINESIKFFNEAGAKRVVKLAVSGGFHSPLMKKAENEFGEFLDKALFKKARIPVISNYTAEVSVEPETIKETLRKQITGSVKWQQSVNKMLKMANIFIEVGPGKILSGLVKRISTDCTILNVEDSESLQKTIDFLRKEY